MTTIYLTTIYTRRGSQIITVSADWSQGSCVVKGDPCRRQVADFQHEPEEALRAALENCTLLEGMPAHNTKAAIEEAMATAVLSDEDQLP